MLSNKVPPLTLLLPLLVVSLLFSVALGAVFIPPGTLVKMLAKVLPGTSVQADWPAYYATILWQMRLPHTLMVALTGASLASSGAAFQGLFRNPLADPFLIGVASGAGLGAVLAMTFNFPQSVAGMALIPVAAFIGGAMTVMVVYWLARIGSMVPLTTLILAGVAVGSFTSALTSFLMIRSEGELYRAVSFLLGGSTMAGWKPFLAAAPYMLLGMAALSLSGHILNVLQFGEEEAGQLGLPVERAKLFILATASLTAAAAVAFSGVIGFVGLIIPHLVRILWGQDYRRLVWLSILGGAIALLLADMLGRVLLAPQSLPVGIVTALAGAPFFLWILRRAKREVFW